MNTPDNDILLDAELQKLADDPRGIRVESNLWDRISDQIKSYDAHHHQLSEDRKRRYPRRTAVLAVAVVAVLSAGGVAALGADGIANLFGHPKRPNPSTISPFALLDGTSTPSMTSADYHELQKMLPVIATPDALGNSGLDLGDLPPRANGRTLLKLSNGRSLSAIRMKNNEVCYVGHPTSKVAVAACVHEMQDRIATSGSWTEAGEQLFGFVADGATTVTITTNTGDRHDAILHGNAFWWDSDDSTRSVYAASVDATFSDGSSATSRLPKESSAARASPTQ